MYSWFVLNIPCSQPIDKCVEVKEEWCIEVNSLLLQQIKKLSRCMIACVLS